MRIRTLAFAATAAIALSGCATVYESAADEVGTATINDRNGNNIGSAKLFSLAGEITIAVALDGLPAGTHGVHLHTTGNCSAADFTSAGGHLNPGGAEHGTQNPRGAHLGDLPNATIAADGSGTVSTILRGTADTVLAQIFDADGTAIVVHAGPDDYRSDPAGDAGSRIACGVFSRS